MASVSVTPDPSVVGLAALPAGFYRRDVRVVAPELLNKVLVRGRRRARIVEVEAYGGADDAGSHAHRGQTRRNTTMFGSGGLLYVYFTYGMHWCANVVCGEEGDPMAVLLRAAAPLTGLDEMRAARARVKQDRELCSGPAKLAQAFGLDRHHDGVDLTKPSAGLPWIGDDGLPPPVGLVPSRRIGLTHGVDELWRWSVPGDVNCSRP